MPSYSARKLALCLALFGAIHTRVLAAQVVQTGDVTKRGLKPTDFPRARQLVPGVYAYEALRARRSGRPDDDGESHRHQQ
jgi:hypothetical protein